MSQRIRQPGSGPSTTAVPAPFHASEMTVEDAWIDYNGHLNMAYYHVLFDRAADEFIEALGIGPSYVKERNATLFTLEAHICYLRELKAGDRVSCASQLLGHDLKRLHFFQTLGHTGEGFASATCEQVAIHIDLATRKSAPFPADRLLALDACADAHAALPRPARAGRAVGLTRQA